MSITFTVISTNSKNSEMNYKETIDLEKYLQEDNEKEPRIINKFYNGYGSYYKIYQVNKSQKGPKGPRKIVPIMYIHEFRDFLIESKAVYKALTPHLCHDIIVYIITIIYIE